MSSLCESPCWDVAADLVLVLLSIVYIELALYVPLHMSIPHSILCSSSSIWSPVSRLGITHGRERLAVLSQVWEGMGADLAAMKLFCSPSMPPSCNMAWCASSPAVVQGTQLISAELTAHACPQHVLNNHACQMLHIGDYVPVCTRSMPVSALLYWLHG